MSVLTRRINVSWRNSPITVTTYKRRTYTPTFATALAEWERLARAEGIPFNITQGGFNGSVSASGKTHHGDAVDLSVRGLSQHQVTRLITIGRMLGFAAWFRTTSVAKWGTRAHRFSSYHIHAVANMWGIAHPAAVDQARSYRNGRDGLASNQKDLGPGHVGNYRTRTWQEYVTLRPTAPDIPPLPTAPTTKTPTSGGGLNMSSDEFKTVMAALNEIKEQNRAIHNDTAGREAMNKRREEDTLATWRFPIHRSSGPVAVISEMAAQTNMLTALSALVSTLAKKEGLDEKAVVKGVIEGILPTMRQAIVAAQGEVELEMAEEFAEAVFQRFRKAMEL